MVFLGKPSLACAPCRAKRRRCDLARPACGSCRRAGVECTGYRPDDESSFAFKDQTTIVKAKVQRTKATSSKPNALQLRAAASSRASPSSTSSTSNDACPSPVDPPLLVTVDDLGSSLFFRSFVNTNHPIEPPDPLYSDLPSRTSIPSMLQDIVTAIGLAMIPRHQKNVETNTAALAKYASSLSLTRKALTTALELTNDDLLLTIMLLAVYESVTRTANSHTWNAHIDGARRLVESRGQKQFLTKKGVVMFLHLRSNVIYGCLWRSLTPPNEFWGLSRQSAPYQSVVQLKATELAEISVRVCRLKEAIWRNDEVVTEASMEEVRNIGSELTTWSESIPRLYNFSRVHNVPLEFNFAGYYDTYATRWIAHIWNNYRCLRIIMCQFSHRYYLGTSYHGDEFATSRLPEIEREADTMSADICAGVAFLFLGAEPAIQKVPDTSVHHLVALVGILIYLVEVPIIPSATQSWIYDQLDRMSEKVGLGKVTRD